MNKIHNSKVSIILPTYNGVRYIKQSIDSCLNQTYTNIELIIVDDGSSEDIREVIRSYTDDRIFYFRHDKNLGLPYALNTGFSHSKGEYLTWTSDDNFYDKKAIETMVKYLERNSEIDFVYANYYVINEDGRVVEAIKVSPSKVLDWKNCIGPCFLYRRKVYEKIGEHNPVFVLAEDYEYWLRVREFFKMQKLNEYLYFYRRHKNSLSAQSKNTLIEEQMAKASQKYVSLGARYYHQGWVFLYKNNYPQAIQCFIKSLFFNPFHFIIWGALFYSLLNIISPSFAENLRKLKNTIRAKCNKIF